LAVGGEEMSWKVYTRTAKTIVWQFRVADKINELALDKGDGGLWYVFYKPAMSAIETVNTPNKSKSVALSFARLWMRQHPKG
jgi:hypothetical protein